MVALTVAGVRGPSYLTEGRLTKTGSGLLHLGFILFGIVVVALQKSTWMMPVFSAATLFSIVGTAMAFYANRIAWHRPTPAEEAPFEWDGDGVEDDAGTLAEESPEADAEGSEAASEEPEADAEESETASEEPEADAEESGPPFS